MAYNKRKQLTLQTAYLDANQTEFPCLVRIVGDTDMRIANSDGFDVRFTAANGSTLLNYERESWSGGGGSTNVDALFWVKSDISTSGTTVYIYYRSEDTADGDNRSNVWDSSFKGVWHCYDDPNTSTIQDSTSNNRDGTKKGAAEPVEATGQVGKGQSHDGTNDYISISTATLSTGGDFTVSVWVNKTDKGTSDDNDRMAALVTDANNNFQLLCDDSKGKYAVLLKRSGSGVINQRTYGAFTAGSWVHLAYVVSGTSGTFYKNGVSISDDGGATVYDGGVSGYNFGRRPDATASTYLKGLLDEIRLSNYARSASWTKFEYYNMNENDAEWTWGSEEASSGGQPARKRLSGVPFASTIKGAW